MLNDWFDEVKKDTEEYFKNTSREEILADMQKSGYDFYQKHGINFIDYSICEEDDTNERRFTITQEDNTHMENEIKMKDSYSSYPKTQVDNDNPGSYLRAA